MSESIDLLSLVLTLRPLEALTEVPPLGRAAHALLLKAIDSVDADLAQRLHAGSDRRPFTASDLIGLSHKAGLRPDRTYTLRLTALTAPVAQALLKATEPPSNSLRPSAGGETPASAPLAVGRGAEGEGAPIGEGQALTPNPSPIGEGSIIELGPARLRIEAVDAGFDPASSPQSPTSSPHHPWARATSYEALSAPWLLGRAMPPRSVTLQFVSPTTFKSGGRHVPLPLPALVFDSLLGKWNAFAPVAFPPELQRYAEECLALSSYQLRSRGVQLKEGGLRMGGVGFARYVSTSFDRYWMSLIQLLSEYALFAGVGAGTGMGLGQCRQTIEVQGRAM